MKIHIYIPRTSAYAKLSLDPGTQVIIAVWCFYRSMPKLLLDQVSPDKSNAASHHKHCITQILKTNGS